jgi:hypothetical protein
VFDPVVDHAVAYSKLSGDLLNDQLLGLLQFCRRDLIATVGFWVIIVLAVLPMSCLSIRVRPLLRQSNGETAIEYPLIMM